jgi:hypothetical protein
VHTVLRMRALRVNIVSYFRRQGRVRWGCWAGRFMVKSMCFVTAPSRMTNAGNGADICPFESQPYGDLFPPSSRNRKPATKVRGRSLTGRLAGSRSHGRNSSETPDQWRSAYRLWFSGVPRRFGRSSPPDLHLDQSSRPARTEFST